MSEVKEGQENQTAENKQPVQQAQPKLPTEQVELKVFTRNEVKRFIPVDILLPLLYPGYAPWGFKFKLALSKDMDEKKQEFLSLSAQEQTDKDYSQSLDEICDLMLELPTGFGDLNPEGRTVAEPGKVFRAYVQGTTDSEALQTLKIIVKGAANEYWTKIAPRSFRGTV